jgi:hypothetical protein
MPTSTATRRVSDGLQTRGDHAAGQ